LTFLLTDIEGSTRLWQVAPAAMQIALARHDVILRQGIKTHGGHVFKTAGDAFFAAFTTPWHALDAALAMQQALQGEAWPPQSPIRVRMALHSGVAELRDGDYFGQPINQVARLLSTGHGGQTLISSATCELCHDRLPTGVVLTSLGEHRLKDLARRQTIYQLGHPSLPHAFAPLRTLLAPLDTRAPSIAVLPFVNLGDEENEYFADGLAEELLNVLAKIRGLRVASRTSAFFFKGKDVDLPTVAHKLNVGAVLEGSVRRSGQRVRITAQLIDAASDVHLWSEIYDRTLDDIFAVQSDIANAVVSELRLALLGDRPAAGMSVDVSAEVQAAERGRSNDPEAYRLYLQGRFYVFRITEADVARGVGFYRQALDRDPTFAIAWAGLARAYHAQAGRGWRPVAEGMEQARAAAQTALNLEPDLPEGHIALGWVLADHDWDWKSAKTEMGRALALAPGDGDVHRASASLAMQFGRLEEAIALARRAVALDPLSKPAHVVLGDCLMRAGLLDDAIASLQLALDLAPNAGITHYILSCARLLQGRADDALDEAEREAIPYLRLLCVALAQHTRGDAVASNSALRRLIDEGGSAVSFQIAAAHAWRGEVDAAFAWLERAYRERDPGLGESVAYPLLRALHGDPRWPALMRKMGFA
jgi:TolB-like protein